MRDMTTTEMCACLMHYILFSVAIADAVQAYEETKDVDAMLKDIKRAGEFLEGQIKGYL